MYEIACVMHAHRLSRDIRGMIVNVRKIQEAKTKEKRDREREIESTASRLWSRVPQTHVYGTVVPLAKTNNLGKRRAPVVYGPKERTRGGKGKKDGQKENERARWEVGNRKKKTAVAHEKRGEEIHIAPSSRSFRTCSTTSILHHRPVYPLSNNS